jgi:hypothetical protein
MMIKSLFVLVVCLIASAGVAAAQQGCPCAVYDSAVTITLSEGPGNTVAVDKTRACVSRQGEVTFQSSEGDFELRFDKNDGTPFSTGILRGRPNQKATAKVSQQNKVKCGRQYRYSIVLKKPGKELKTDPEIIIEPGGGDQ